MPHRIAAAVAWGSAGSCRPGALPVGLAAVRPAPVPETGPKAMVFESTARLKRVRPGLSLAFALALPCDYPFLLDGQLECFRHGIAMAIWVNHWFGPIMFHVEHRPHSRVSSVCRDSTRVNCGTGLHRGNAWDLAQSLTLRTLVDLSRAARIPRMRNATHGACASPDATTSGGRCRGVVLSGGPRDTGTCEKTSRMAQHRRPVFHVEHSVGSHDHSGGHLVIAGMPGAANEHHK